MSARHRWFLRGGFALLAALYWGADGGAAVVPIMGLGDQNEEEEAATEPVVSDSTISEGLKQRLLFMPFRDKSKYKGEWDIYSAMPRGLADSLRGSAFFSTVSIDSALVRLKKKEFQGKLDVERALTIGREVEADYVVLGQIDEMSMKRFRATVPIGGYRSYQGLTTVRLYPYKVIDGEPAGEVIREVAEDSKRYGVTNPAAYVPLEKEYFLLGQMEWGSEEFHNTLLGKSVSRCLDHLAAGLDSLIQPPAALKVSEPKIIEVVADTVQTDTGENGQSSVRVRLSAYINVGLADSVQKGNKYGVWDKGRELKDPDTGEVLGKSLPRRVGVVQVEQVLSQHLSLVRILQGEDAVQKDYGIRAE
ncbi:MAG: hypothetical protein F4Y91_03685 [Gemmatimonadetes bacterium]|nr:hypothetical protein [Gemmatimonadota bacterium]MYB70546.1 hypothetical protein [Gemmatimonadota bacterium]